MISKTSPIRTKKISEIVEDRLLKLIKSQNLEPGDAMPSERELMELYEVGRPAIREAMQNLQRLGLVDIRHGERPKIAQPSMESLIDQMSVSMQHMLTHSKSSMEHLKQARSTLDAEMARIAATRRTDQDIAIMREMLRKQASAKHNSQKFLELDGQFHKHIASISGNPIFETVTAAVFDWLRVFHVDLVRKPGLESLTLEEHRTILHAIEAGDPEAAAGAMRLHLNRANKLYSKSNYLGEPE